MSRISRTTCSPWNRWRALSWLIVCLAIAIARAEAQDLWTGGGADANWMTAGNWQSGAIPTAGDNLTFGGSTNPSPNNNFAANTAFSGITFASGATNFTLTGNSINFAGVITNNANNAETINLPLALTAASTIDNTVGNTMSIGGVISGAYKLTFNGSGPVALSGANTFTGGVALTSGTLDLNSSSALGTGTLTIASGATFDNTSGGAITLANNAETWNGSINYNGSNSLNLGTGAISLASPVTLNGYGSVLTVPGVISGANSLAIAGYSTVVLSGANTYSGGLTLSGGTLDLNNAGALGNGGTFTISGGTIDNTSGAAITLGNNPEAWGSSINFTGSRSLNLGAGAVTLNSTAYITVSANTLTVGGLIGAGSSNGLTLYGPGTLALMGAGNYASGYTGATTLYSGMLQASDGAGGSLGSGPLAINGGTFQIASTASGYTENREAGTGAGQISITNGGFSAIGGPVTLAIGDPSGSGLATITWNNSTPTSLYGGQTLNFGSTTSNAALTVNNPIDLAGSSQTINVTAGVGGDSTTLAGIVSDGSFTQTGASTLILTNAGNSFTSVTVGGGILQATEGGSLPATANLSLGGASTPGMLQLQSASGGVTESRNVTTTTGAGNLQFGAAGGGFSAVGGPITVSLAVGGTAGGTLVWGSTPGFLSSGVPLYFGTTTANNVTTLTNPINLNGAAKTVNVASGAGGDSATISGAISSSASGGVLVKTGAGLLTLTGVNTYANGTTINGGTLEVSGSGTLGAVTTSTANTSNVVNLNNSATLNLGGTTQSVYAIGGGAGGAVGSILNGTIDVGNGLINLRSGTYNANFGEVSGFTSGRIFVNGGGASAVTVLGGNNSGLQYSDTHTAILGNGSAAGTIQITNPNALGSAASQTQIFSAILDLDGTANVSQASIAAFSNTNDVAQLINSNTTTAASTAAKIELTMAANIDLGGAGNMTLSGPILWMPGDNAPTGSSTPDGGINKIGAGTLTIGSSTTASTYQGPTEITAGTLQIATGSVTALPATTAVTIANAAGTNLNLNGTSQTIASLSGGGSLGGNIQLGAGELTINGSATTTYGGVISGAGGLTIAGTTNLSLSNTETYAGPTTISGGTLTLGNGASVSITNPSFETPNIGTGGGAYQYAPTGTGIGWTFEGSSGSGSGLAGNGSGFNNATAPAGTQVAFVQATGYFSQSSLAFPISETYQLTFYSAYRNGEAGVNPFEVELDGKAITGSAATSTITPTTYAGQTGAGTGLGGYLVYTIDFTAAAGAHTLEFLGLDTGGGDRTSFIDDVQISGLVGALPATSDVQLTGNTSVLNANSASQTIATLSGIAGSSVTLGAGTLTIGGGSTTTAANFLGSISDAGLGGAVVMNAPGVVETFSGANTYTGATTISAGSLLIDGSHGASGAYAGNYAVSGGTLGGSGSINFATTATSGATVAAAHSSCPDTIPRPAPCRPPTAPSP